MLLEVRNRITAVSLQSTSLPVPFGPFPTPSPYFSHSPATLRWLHETCPLSLANSDPQSYKDPWSDVLTLQLRVLPLSQMNHPQPLHSHSLFGIPPELPTTNSPFYVLYDGGLLTPAFWQTKLLLIPHTRLKFSC